MSNDELAKALQDTLVYGEGYLRMKGGEGLRHMPIEEIKKPPTAWQPIATAPQDRPILILGTLHNMLCPKPEMMVAEWSRGWWCAGHTVSHVTHWHELPSFP